MADILAIVSRAIFERDAVVAGNQIQIGDVWGIDRYVSTHRTFDQLRQGGRIILVTVRPPDEALWFVGVIDAPLFEGNAWVSRTANNRPITNISALRRTIMFASGRGLSQDSGTLGMSLQTPRVLTDESAAEILAVVGGARPAPRATAPSMMTAAQSNANATQLANSEGGADELRVIEEDPEQHRARLGELEKAVARFVVLFDKMQETYGLRLPESLAYGVGFLLGLSVDERAAMTPFCGTLIGVGTWFDDAHNSPAPDNDERLRDRIPTDPPELVPLLANEKGERWGLWYDDSDELPTAIAMRRPSPPELRDSRPEMETLYAQPTLLATLRARLREWYPPNETVAPYQLTTFAWLDVVLRREAANVREKSAISKQDGHILGAYMSPYLGNTVARLPTDMWRTETARCDAYLKDSPAIEEWVEQARSDLHDGAPGRALIIGRELHAFQATTPSFHVARSELLLRAYSAVARQPLADVFRASFRHFHPSLTIYELPPPHPVVSAVDVDANAQSIERALHEGSPPSADDIEEALARPNLTTSALDTLLAYANSHSLSTDSALWRRLVMLFRGKSKEANHHRKLAIRLMERTNVSARVFERILLSADAELLTFATTHVDLGSTGGGGATPLHLAARAASLTTVKALLERGADPLAKNADGRTAFDSAREALTENPHDVNASEILTKLQLAGGGIAKPPLPASDEIDYEEGDEVHHPKLGDGVVESVTGEGGEAKLKIRFEKETRTLLAKFVTPK